jgi:hypothetical protein
MRFAVVGPLLLMGTAAFTCVEGPGRSQMGVPPGSDGGVVEVTGPASTFFALGIWDNSSGVPQGASLVNLYFDEGVRDSESVVAMRTASPPTLDGEASDWEGNDASPIGMSPRGTASGFSEELWKQEYLLATGSAPIFDFGIYEARVKAAYDDQNIYFLVQWNDNTQDDRRGEWFFDGVKWSRNLMMNEDKLSFAFNIDDTTRGFDEIGCAVACHMHTRLGDVSDAGRAYRFRMHTKRPGEITDVWTWKAATTNPMAHSDDSYWDDLGRKSDGPTDWIISNSVNTDAGAMPAYMSADGVNANPSSIYSPDAGTPVAVPFDGTAAVAGARIPGYVMQWASPNRDGVRAVGKWSNGQWTVELARERVSADLKDVRFLP